MSENVRVSTVPVGHDGTEVSIQEKQAKTANGWLMLLLTVVILALSILGFIDVGITQESTGEVQGWELVLSIIALILASFMSSMLTIVSPGDTKVVQFFGNYIGTIRKTGMMATLPFTARRKVSIKVHNFETSELKVNDSEGNPVNIAAIVVWQVADTAKAVFAVEDYEEFIHTQSESALRHVATAHPYDTTDPNATSLRGSIDVVADELAHEVAQRVATAGIEVIETRISSLAYAPEIAHAMLQRQQADAVIAAREKIVEGAVSMVEGALNKLEEENVVELDDERKAAMVSNLLVVLCGSTQAAPIVNAGTLYN
ncbi:MAG: SPFH domain-containing protein [Propionibacteriaceae bacterium]|jgi:regulator of protease activity HflC (stomatin/prohibitin superfamily)|nr:SPFH domain-containing protein [Propionibacteriaceae bacterium]